MDTQQGKAPATGQLPADTHLHDEEQPIAQHVSLASNTADPHRLIIYSGDGTEALPRTFNIGKSIITFLPN